MEPGGGPKTIADIMTKEVTSLPPDSSLLDAVNLFGQCEFRHILILDPHGALAGVLSDRDALRAMARTHDPASTKIASIMMRELANATPEMPIADAIDIVVFHRLTCLPVIDRAGKVCGIVTRTDLLGAFHDLLHRLRPRRARASQ